mmetsp:Transcript_14646/g.33045  ORF Transcript_14646/g.33045 Transcript_14646/m.33045 type:complete len:226 (+) Transcript_14646:353-1030(+)
MAPRPPSTAERSDATDRSTDFRPLETRRQFFRWLSKCCRWHSAEQYLCTPHLVHRNLAAAAPHMPQGGTCPAVPSTTARTPGGNGTSGSGASLCTTPPPTCTPGAAARLSRPSRPAIMPASAPAGGASPTGAGGSSGCCGAAAAAAAAAAVSAVAAAAAAEPAASSTTVGASAAAVGLHSADEETRGERHEPRHGGPPDPNTREGRICGFHPSSTPACWPQSYPV